MRVVNLILKLNADISLDLPQMKFGCAKISHLYSIEVLDPLFEVLSQLYSLILPVLTPKSW